MKDAGGGRYGPQGIVHPPQDPQRYWKRNIEQPAAASSLGERILGKNFFVGINFVDYGKVFSESICVKRKTQRRFLGLREAAKMEGWHHASGTGEDTSEVSLGPPTSGTTNSSSYTTVVHVTRGNYNVPLLILIKKS